jgi:hypothetical protein
MSDTCCVRPFCFTSRQAWWNGCAAIPTAD